MDKCLTDFSGWLKRGDFFVLVEVPLPEEKADVPVFEGILRRMQSVLASRPGLKAGIAFTDNSTEKSSDFSVFFKDLSPALKSQSLFYLSSSVFSGFLMYFIPACICIWFFYSVGGGIVLGIWLCRWKV